MKPTRCGRASPCLSSIERVRVRLGLGFEFGFLPRFEKPRFDHAARARVCTPGTCGKSKRVHVESIQSGAGLVAAFAWASGH